MLPEKLKTRQRQRHHAQIMDLANHVQQTCAGTMFMGGNWKSFAATVTELAEQAKKFNSLYADDHMIPEEPGVQSLSAWKGQQLAEVSG